MEWFLHVYSLGLITSHPLKLFSHINEWVSAPLVRQRTTPGNAPSEMSQTLVSILGDQCMRVQNQCSVTNRLQSLVYGRVLYEVAHSGCAVLGKVCADNME